MESYTELKDTTNYKCEVNVLSWFQGLQGYGGKAPCTLGLILRWVVNIDFGRFTPGEEHPVNNWVRGWVAVQLFVHLTNG